MDAGALRATYVHTELTKAQTLVGGTPQTSIFGVAGTAPTASTDQKVKHDHLSAIYTYGPVAATYQYNKLDLTDNLTAGNGRNGKSNQYGVQYTVGAASVFAITGKVTVDSPTTRVNDISNTQYGVRYNLSKRTMAYFMAGESKDSVPTAADKMSKGKMNGVGLMHAF